MGQKIHPLGIRLGINKTWDAKWFSEKNVADYIVEDIAIRDYTKKKLFKAGIGKVMIERAGKAVRVNIHAARPGLVIGKKGADIEALRSELEQFSESKININIIPIRKPELNAQIVGEDIAQQLLKRGSFRRILKKSISRTMAGGAQGIKIKISGRLGGAEIARSEWMKEGRIPLQTLRADIDYGFAESNTSYGKIGVKVWVFTEESIEKKLADAKALVQKSEASVKSEEAQEKPEEIQKKEEEVIVEKSVETVEPAKEVVETIEPAVAEPAEVEPEKEAVADEDSPKVEGIVKPVEENADDEKVD